MVSCGNHCGAGTLVRPETPLLLIAAGIVLLARGGTNRLDRNYCGPERCSPQDFFVPLVPWAARNWSTLHEVQFLAPHYSELPGEFAPLGFNAWVNTWLWRFRDVYLVTWKLEVEEISTSDIPSSAFDNLEQRARVFKIFDAYNETLTWQREERSAVRRNRERTNRPRSDPNLLKNSATAKSHYLVCAARRAIALFRQFVAFRRRMAGRSTRLSRHARASNR